MAIQVDVIEIRSILRSTFRYQTATVMHQAKCKVFLITLDPVDNRLVGLIARGQVC